MKSNTLFLLFLLSGLFSGLTSSTVAQTGNHDLTRQMDWSPHRSSSAQDDLTKNADSRPIESGQELVIADLTGPGVVNHIWCTISSPDLFHGRSHVIRIYYDGLEKPSVEVPLGDFFGIGHGAAADYHSAITTVSSHGRARSCYWRIPFHKQIKITVSNDSDQRTGSFYYYVDWEKHSELPEDTVYFHSSYRQENPTGPEDFLLLDTKGRGHFVGMVYSAQQAELGWFGEGDDRFFIDGEEKPSLSGTGTEDYFNDAWGFRRFATPYFGVPLWEGYLPGDRVTAYRWHLPDPVPFKKSLRVQMETRGSVFTEEMLFLGQFLPREDFVSAAVFWYQWPAVELTEKLPPVKERTAKYQVIPVSELEVKATPETGFTKNKEVAVYRCTEPDGLLEIEFEVPKDGLYQVNALMQYGLIGGVYEAELNGEKIGGPIDFSAKGSLDTLWTRLDLHYLKKGEKNKLIFRGVGTSPHVRTLNRPIHAISISHLVLLRLKDLPGYQKALKAVLNKKAKELLKPSP